MPYELFLAIRYLRARRGRRVARWTAGAAVVGIACGVAALVVATALANGFRDELQDKILRGTAHVTLSREGGAGVLEARAAAVRARGVEGVADAQPTTYEGALLGGPDGANYALLRGLDEGSPRALEGVRATLTRGSLDELFKVTGVENESVPVVLGEELAARSGLTTIGDEGFVLTAGSAASRSPSGAPNAQRVRVVGLFRTGLFEYDSAWAYLSLGSAARAGGDRPPAFAVSVEAHDLYASDEVARRLRGELGAGWTAVDWREANRPLFEALALERRVVALIIMLVTIVAALNITTTLALVVVERRADIAVLSTVGARAPSVTLVFVIEGAIIGAVGAVAGVVLGLVGCWVAEHFQLVRLPPDVYSLSAVPLHPHASDVLVAALAAFAVSLLATLYPAWQAARVRPAEVLRYE
ncbi:MAG: lipoprotein-releasing system permease protein [Acidobacteriota bacterium]|jgi:lipoprotein-releasing system permease protein|nr:lipoprotein-releasing system permease protein [Acidobacteriota bacterium]